MPVTGTGFDFADFLLGLPQQTSVQYGAESYGYHFRGNSWDLYAQDEWRIRGNLTFNIGVRYEYVSPFSEINNGIVNLDIAPGLHCGRLRCCRARSGRYRDAYPITLVNPDRNNFAPRVGIAWKPLQKTVVRAGYGINYNTTAYQTLCRTGFSAAVFHHRRPTSSRRPRDLTLQNGFPGCTAVRDTDHQQLRRQSELSLGYVQIWNLDIQQRFGRP